MRYKLLALDLDGTALGSDPDAFAPGLAEAAAAAAERGCIVAAATGRPAGCLPAALDPVPAWMQWLVLDDGAEVIDPRTGARLWRRAFGADSLDRVEQAARRGGFPVEYIDGDSWYHVTPAGRRMLESSPDVTPFHKGVLARRGRPLEGPAVGLACRDILKINALLVPGPARDAFFAEVEGAALAMDCGGGAIELTAPGAGKLAAVRRAGGVHGQRARPRPAGGPGRHRPQHRGRRGASHPPLAAGRIGYYYIRKRAPRASAAAAAGALLACAEKACWNDGLTSPAFQVTIKTKETSAQSTVQR